MKVMKLDWIERMVKSMVVLLGLVLMPLTLSAQIIDEDEEDEEDDVEEEEIILTDQYGNTDEIDFPAAMTDNLDSLMNLYASKTYISTDNNCQTSNTDPTYSREEYIDRLYRMPTIMEMPYNEVVRACIDRYTVRLRRQVSWMLGAANFYMPIFEEALEAYQLPLELKYLPIIESALNPIAVSRAGACGLWQFMPGTAKMYNLEVNSLLDERRDPVKASYAAAHFLSDLYKVFGDWNLVIAAYNCGPENINKAIRRSGGERDYWKIYPYLPRETRGYVPAFIAANYAMTYYCEHNICPMSTQLPVKTDTVMLSRNVKFSEIADICGMDIEMIRSLNPAYRHDMVPGATRPMPLKLPLNDINRFVELEDSLFAAHRDDKRMEVELNEHIIKDNTGNTGHKSKRSGRRGRGGKGSKGSSTVTVKKGDTLSAIAKRNNTTVANIKRLNGIKGNNIRAGKKLRVK